jgi:hypothetical protein
MSRYTLYKGLLLNLEQKIPVTRRRDYLSREQAYEMLKKKTGKDFGHNVEKWRGWLKEQGEL